MLTASTVLAISYAFFIVNFWISSREQLVSSLHTLTKAVSINATAALVFHDEQTATELLNTLSADMDIEYAVLRNANGDVFAEYRRMNSSSVVETDYQQHITELLKVEATTDDWQYKFYADHLAVEQSIKEKDRFIGSLGIRVSLSSYKHMLNNWMFFGLLGLLVVLYFGYFISSRLQNVIIKPIEKLIHAMHAVSEISDYSRRVENTSTDEFGVMVDGFNTMIGQIQERDEALKLARDTAEEASLAKSRFLATMSHEIRTPMNGVLGMTELLLNSSLSPDQKRQADTIQRSGTALLNIINDILDYSKIEANQLKLESIRFDLYEQIEEVLQLLSETVNGKKLTVSHDFDPDFNGKMLGDPIRIRQILLNLVGNALKFTQAGYVSVNVAVVFSGKNPYVRIEVHDSGPGISEDAREKIFESFSQADSSTTRKYGGTGLGLAISKQLVGLMRGNIGVDSELDTGSVFWFELPLDRQSFKCVVQGKTLLQGIRALIYGQHNVEMDFLHDLLTDWGVVIERAAVQSEVEEKIQAAVEKNNAFNLVLLDTLGNETEAARFIHALNYRYGQFATKFMVLASKTSPLMGLPGYVGIIREDQGAIKPSVFLAALCDLLLPEGHVSNSTVPLIGQTDKALAELQGHILLVEDNAVNQQVATGLLKMMGCSFDTATNGAEAIDKWRNHPYDLILMDIEMPIMDGITAASCIREEEVLEHLPYTPIVAVTANAMDGDSELYLSRGMDDYLSKPYSRQSLHKMLTHWLKEQAPLKFSDMDVIQKVSIDSELCDLNMQQVDSFNDLQDDDGQPLLGSLIATYIENSNQIIIELNEALRQKDFEEIRRLSHALKSSSGTLGLDKVHALSREIEEGCRMSHTDNLQAQYQLLVQANQTSQQKLVDLM
ncbi:Signal transduction histidine kinase [Neptunomonas qingdaonensis]|uniref:histidine kinase n=2 Tax=Neptunomonas qingdaonensis TaxID=1045558 RepID=A0A1I2TIC7_9GAMM|nr:Signal transduction histidine kinase [Neptunomonas qingdaonensis]